MRPLLAVMVAAAGALSLVALGHFVTGLLGPILVVAGVFAALVAAWNWPALLLLVVVRRAQSAGAASGLLQLGSGAGSAIGPSMFGAASALGGREWAWVLMVGCTVLAVVLVRGAEQGAEVRIRTERDDILRSF